MKVLTFQLCGPLVSWGSAGAIGSARPTWMIPPPSALAGLVGAALGVPREDAAGLRDLTSDYVFAVRVDAHTGELSDYHTVQTASAVQAKAVAKQIRRPTRGELLREVDFPQTALTERAYRTDFAGLVMMLVRPGVEARWSLEAVSEALRRPHWPLYLGRRACVPSAPVDPRLTEVDDLVDLVKTDDRHELRLWRNALRRTSWPRPAPSAPRLLQWQEGVPLLVAGATAARQRVAVTNRRTWQFADQVMHTATLGAHDVP